MGKANHRKFCWEDQIAEILVFSKLKRRGNQRSLKFNAMLIKTPATFIVKSFSNHGFFFVRYQ